MSPVLLSPSAIDLMFQSCFKDALDTSEIKLRNIVENSVDGVVLVDQEGYIVMWSPGQERITGLSAGEALGTQLCDVIRSLTPVRRRNLAFHKQLRQRLLTVLHSGVTSSMPPSVELEIARASGELRIVQQYSFVMSTAEGPRLGCVFRDVTDFRHATRNLLRRNAELSLVNRINTVLASSLDPEQVRKTVLNEVVQLLNIAGASIWLIDETSRALVCAQSLGRTGDAIPEAVFSTWQALADCVVHSPQTLLAHPPAQAGEPADPAADQVAAGASWTVQSFACIPMCVRGRILGVLLLVDDYPNRFNEADISVLESIAAAAATAFENACLHHKAQELATLLERQRLAVHLHDAINQSLFSAGLIAEVLPRLIDRDPLQARNSVLDLRTLLRGAVADLREVLAELQPSLVDRVGFDVLLSQLAAGYTGRTGTTVAINVADNVRFPGRIQETLYRACRELFVNIAKHAEATQVWVELARRQEGVVITIRDNGCGFDLHQIPARHFGLTMLQTQAAEIGAKVNIVSEIGQGTEISIVIPDTAT